MHQEATRFLRRAWLAPPVLLCRNPGALRSPDSRHGMQPVVLVLVRFIRGGWNLGSISCPESGLPNGPGFRPRNSKNSGRAAWQWCHSCVPCLPLEKPIPCPSPGETWICQFHGGCDLQPAPQAEGAAGLLKISGLECYKQLSARQGMWPLLVTELYRQKMCPDSGHKIKTSFWNLGFDF